MYECFHCGTKSVSWDADFNFEDFSMEGEGIVHVCHCSHCGAIIHYMIRYDQQDIDEAIKKNDGGDNQ